MVVATPTPTPTPTADADTDATPTATAVTPAAIVAKDSSSPARNWFQDAASTDEADNSVTVGPGGSVTFSYPTGASAHNVVFDAHQPASCTQTAGSDFGAVPPLPAFPAAGGLGRPLHLRRRWGRTRSSAPPTRR